MAVPKIREQDSSLWAGTWSEWASKVLDEDELNRSKHRSGHADSMKLKRDDMPLFGLCPAQDEFYLVVCETCKQVVKPQALQRHMEVRHSKKSRYYSPRRRKTSSTSSTTLSPTMTSPSRLTPPTRDERRAHSGTRSSKHDAHGKTPPDEGGGGGSGTKLGLEYVKSPNSKHHHALSETALASLHKQTDKQLQNHSMPVVKMERLPRTMSAKNNAPTLHVPPHSSSSNHKSAHHSSSALDSKSGKSTSKEQRNKSKELSSSTSSHLSRDISPPSSKDENLETKDRTEVGNITPKLIRDKKLDHADLSSKLSDEEDGISLAKLKSESSLRSSKAEQGSESISRRTNDVSGKHDVHNNSVSTNDTSPTKKFHSLHHHSSSEGNKSAKHKHSHNHSDKERGSKHREHTESSIISKHRQDKLTWSSSHTKSPESGNNNGSKHCQNSSNKASSKITEKYEVLVSKEKHEVASLKDKHCVASKDNDSGKENIVANVSKETSSSVISDKRWNDITKLSGGTKISENKLDSRNWIKLDERSEKKTNNSWPENDGKQNGAAFATASKSSNLHPTNSIGSDSQSHLFENNRAKSSGLGSDDHVEHNEKRHKPPSLNLSLLTSSSLTSPSLTSPTTPVLTSPETPASSTKHLDKIDIHSPTSTFGKKLAAFQNPGKLVPCKDREYNPDIHCGVISKEENKPCTRSLTCKSHALSLRRAVGGRVKPFDELLLEHRAAKEAFLLAKHGDGHPSGGKVSKPSSASKSSHSASLAKIKSPSSSLATKSHSMHLLSSRITSPISASSVKSHRLPSSVGHHIPHRVLPLSTQLPPKPTQIASLPVSGPIPVPEMFTLPGMSDTDDDEDLGDRYEYPVLYHHPRPAMVNNFGCRNTGHGCYMFNRRTDQLRAVFKLAVDRRLHPPPNKRLCLDSKLGVTASPSAGNSSSAKDPYEFGTGSPSLSAAKSAKSKSHHKTPGSTSKSPANKSQHKAKEDHGSVGGINYSVLFEGGSYVEPLSSGASQQPDVFTTGQPTITTAAGLISQRSSSSDMGNSVGPAAKRKRSGSSPRPALPSVSNTTATSIGGFALNNANNAISIAIPTGSLNLNLSSTTLNTLNATIAGNKLSQLAAGNKDVNLVVTGGTTTVLNGQLFTSPSTTHRNVDGSGSQVHQKHSSSSTAPTTQQKSKSRKRNCSRSLSGHDVHPTSMNAVSMDSVAMVTTSGFGVVTSPSPAMTPSPIFPTGTATSMPNGIIGQQGVKGMTSLNHVGGDVSVLTQDGSGTSETRNALERHQPASKHKKLSHKHQKALQQQQQQHSHRVASSPSSFSTSQRLITSVPYGIHGNSAVSGAAGYSHIQIQSKDPSGKTLTGKLAMQPMSLTLMPPGGSLSDGLAVMQGQGAGAAGQRALLIPTPPDPHHVDRGPPHRHPSHHSHHEAIPQLTLQNSPSSLIS